MSSTPSLKLTNLGNKFTVNSFFPYLRLTVKIFQFLRLSTKFLAVLRLSVNPIKTLNEASSFLTFLRWQIKVYLNYHISPESQSKEGEELILNKNKIK